MTDSSKRCVGCGKVMRKAKGQRCRKCQIVHGHKARQFCRDCGRELATSGKSAVSLRCRDCNTKYRAQNPSKPPTRPCLRCGAPTKKRNQICPGCDSNQCSRRADWSGNPETCPLCEGLPWRRGENRLGERVVDVCSCCGLPYAEEPALCIEMFAKRGEAA